MTNQPIIHISEVDISLTTGMGRVEHQWGQAFERAGYPFIHIGPREVGPFKHRMLFRYKALKYYKKLNISPKAIIVHEPSSGPFAKIGVPCFLESHGVERRGWEKAINGTVPSNPISLKTRILYPLWRLSACDEGLRKSNRLLLINSEDKEYVMEKYNRKSEDIFLFKNGVNHFDSSNEQISKEFTVLFNGSWGERKGISILIQAAKILFSQKILIRYLLIGTEETEANVLNYWPAELRPYVRVVPHFEQADEIKYLDSSSVFVLPSYFEGQPLSLLQAMVAGKCCITTNCCGQKDIISNGETGLLFEVGDVNGLATLIKKCYNEQDFRTEIGRKAKIYAEGLTWELVSDEVAAYVLRNS